MKLNTILRNTLSVVNRWHARTGHCQVLMVLISAIQCEVSVLHDTVCSFSLPTSLLTGGTVLIDSKECRYTFLEKNSYTTFHHSWIHCPPSWRTAYYIIHTGIWYYVKNWEIGIMQWYYTRNIESIFLIAKITIEPFTCYPFSFTSFTSSLRVFC